ncbi:MAG TPA: tRNA dihydrouridine synthase DusB [Kineosporiaceae bacterium]|nr:tRNA dihydrouridine synthase DusB [Kineosporiaceae bacterium]
MTLRIGPFELATPVVLAPMAGITNQAFRRLCREQAESGLVRATGRTADRPAVFVSEMVTSRALLERNDESLRLIAHDPGESPRSVQLYGVDPGTVGAAVRMLVEEDRADHIDLNFGCPVPKVTRKGGGAALPWKLDLFGEIVARAVRAAGPAGVPVTVKMRMGVDADHVTYLDAGRRAAAEGAAAVALHGRTAADYYSGTADWQAIARLKEAVSEIPVLGNGDIWSADDALRMVAETGCDGVVVGRGCLGRPWLFADLAAAFHGDPGRTGPPLGTVIATMRRHLDLLIEHYATAGGRGPVGATPGEWLRHAQSRACRDIRKHIAWYLKGYSVGHEIRLELAHVGSVEEFERIVARLDGGQPYPGEAAEGPRGRTGSPRRVSLPEGWLDRRELTSGDATEVLQAELSVSGG